MKEEEEVAISMQDQQKDKRKVYQKHIVALILDLDKDHRRVRRYQEVSDNKRQRW